MEEKKRGRRELMKNGGNVGEKKEDKNGRARLGKQEEKETKERERQKERIKEKENG